MNGPEHFREAEQLIAQAEGLWGTSEAEHDALLRNAQVHATLALTAATAAAQATLYDGDESHDRARGWAGVA